MFRSALAASTILALGGIGLALAQNNNGNGNSNNNNNNRDHDKHDPVAAPEIDPASAISALTLLAGGLAVVRGRRSK